MKKLLLFILCLMPLLINAQAPVIEGDLMLCPNDNGTATVTSATTYDTYQWYYKYWFTTDEFEPIAGATTASFIYDWMTYDQALLKVVVTLGAQTYESNTIQIDSWVFTGLVFSTETSGNVVFDPNSEGYLLCEGGTITNTVMSPYTIVQWYKNGEEIPGATNVTLVITEPGTYYATAAPAACPNSVGNTLPTVVNMNPTCDPTPVIAGDILICPFTDGTANVTNGIVYETYQWYYKYWFTDEEFVPIEGATSASFTYDWLTYDQALLKVVVTLEGETYESNTIQIDSHTWVSLTYGSIYSEDVEFDNENFTILICEDSTITNTLNSPYDTNIQWYRDGMTIEGANDITFVITEPGVYHVVAAPAICPNSTSSTATTPMVVAWNPDCALGIENPDSLELALYPNPASDILNISLPGDIITIDYSIIDITGKALLNGTAQDSQIDISGLANGSYIIKLNGGEKQYTKMFIKK